MIFPPGEKQPDIVQKLFRLRLVAVLGEQIRVVVNVVERFIGRLERFVKFARPAALIVHMHRIHKAGFSADTEIIVIPAYIFRIRASDLHLHAHAILFRYLRCGVQERVSALAEGVVGLHTGEVNPVFPPLVVAAGTVIRNIVL